MDIKEKVESLYRQGKHEELFSLCYVSPKGMELLIELCLKDDKLGELFMEEARRRVSEVAANPATEDMAKRILDNMGLRACFDISKSAAVLGFVVAEDLAEVMKTTPEDIEQAAARWPWLFGGKVIRRGRVQ